MKTISVNLMEYSEFDKLIKDNYPKPKFTFLATEEKGNDTVYLYNVVKKPLDEYELEHMFESAQWLLTDLCNRGIVPEGYYLVRVSW